MGHMHRFRWLGLVLIQASLIFFAAACNTQVAPPTPSGGTSVNSTSTEMVPTELSEGTKVTPSPTKISPAHSIEATKARPNYVARGNLMRSREKFVQQKAGRVAFLGGSVTNLAWREKVMSYLVQRFPDTSFDFINAGLNGTPAELGAFRLEEDVFSNGPVDLLFLEFAVNGGSMEAMEGIVRHARTLNPDIDIIQMHIAARWFSDSLDKGVVPDVVTVHEKVAEHYGNSSLHLYREIYDRMNEGRFTWEQFGTDGVHPNEFGSTIYANFINGFLEMMWSRQGENPTPASMPPPLAQDPWEHGSLIPYDKASSIIGFENVTDWMPALNGNLKQPVSFIAASVPGSTISFSFHGTQVGLYSLVGPDSAIVEYRIDDSGWQQLDTSRDSWYPNDWYRLNGFILSTSLSNSAHIITFRTMDNQNKVFRIFRLMIG